MLINVSIAIYHTVDILGTGTGKAVFQLQGRIKLSELPIFSSGAGCCIEFLLLKPNFIAEASLADWLLSHPVGSTSRNMKFAEK